MKRTLLSASLLLLGMVLQGQVLFQRDFSPSEGLTNKYEKDYREEICLNGYWDIQIADTPKGWKRGTGNAPELPQPADDRWEEIRIKIPSPINVNSWSGPRQNPKGRHYLPYAPSPVYYPSYPEKWDHAQMGWLRRSLEIPADWDSRRVILHFEAVAGECTLYVNGKEVCTNFESYLPFEADITEFVTAGEPAEILLGIRGSKLFDKHHELYTKFSAVYPPGSNTDGLIGIWQDVYLFGLPETRVTDVFAQPYLDRDELVFEVTVTNDSRKKQKVTLEGDVRKWMNRNLSEDPRYAPEISWDLDNAPALTVAPMKVVLNPGETKTVTMAVKVDGRLEKWSPDEPNLYTLLLDVKSRNRKVVDRKTTRFGWRQFKIVGEEFHLNGSRIQCFGDIQHPFGPYICSRRFAWAWYTMIKDFGGNAVRPHAQPWPRVYYDLADEMGLMVLDETALFGSSIRLNLEEDITWERSEEHYRRLIMRDRNHPSVIGWSAGNEMFAIALLNKPEKAVSDVWDGKMVDMTLKAGELDPTRDFLTLDGDRDMDGRLPVWSKHFGHGLRINDLPPDLDKPLIVGECGATYYGKPIQLYPFSREKAFESYYGRNEALAVDIYQNALKMAKPYLSYFSPSEVCWFGIEHLGIGYSDYTRIPTMEDGVFAGKPYEEGKPGYQFERIPPYASTFNPGLDPSMPVYKPLPMFEALKAALAGEDCPWSTFHDYKLPEKPALPPAQFTEATFLGDADGALHDFLKRTGVGLTDSFSSLIIVDAHTYNGGGEKIMELAEKKGAAVWVMMKDSGISPEAQALLPADLTFTERKATALENNRGNAWGSHFILPDLYFAEMKGDRHILKNGLSGDFTAKSETVLTASRTDWSLFNDNPENRKCAGVVLYEQLQKPEGTAMATLKSGNVLFIASALDYTINTAETARFWKTLLPVMGIELNGTSAAGGSKDKKEHDLLMDGPVD